MAYAFNNDKSKYSIDWIIDYIISKTHAYAVFDGSDGTLTFFRDEEGKYTNGQRIGTKTYYTNVETANSRKWSSNARDVTKVIFDAVIEPISCEYWFYDMNDLTTIENLELLNTSKVTSMASMFRNCASLTSLDLSSFNTSECTTMGGMFLACENLKNLNLSNFNTSKVTSMDAMFLNCVNLTSLDLSSFNTSKVTDMDVMFNAAFKLNATFTVMNMPTTYEHMCVNTARDSGQLILKYKSPVTSANIDTLVSTKVNGNVINGGQA